MIIGVFSHRLAEKLSGVVDMNNSVKLVENMDEWEKFLKTTYPDVVVLDLQEYPLSYLDSIENDKTFGMIIIDEFPSVESLQKAIDWGVSKYIIKMPNDEEIPKFLNILEQSLSNRICVCPKPEEEYVFKNIVGNSLKIREVFDVIKKISNSDASVLITGESGTGKELVARAIHKTSIRKNGPFVPVDCSAIPENLLEAELFGYEKGAFTGAVSSKPGLFEVAEGGTVFLDEIGEMSLHLQVKLLRVLQERKIRRIGGRKEKSIDVRIIAATKRDLKKGVEEGWFREDLYYRLKVITIQLPPLRERVGDIALLVNYFLSEYARKLHKDINGISREAMHYLESYPWPGNVRELQHAVERMVTLCSANIITYDDLPEDVKNYSIMPYNSPDKEQTYKSALLKFERDYFTWVLEEANANVTYAAKIADVSRRTLQRKIKELGIDRKEIKKTLRRNNGKV